MPGHRTMGMFVLFIALLGAGAILGVRLTQGQEPDQPQASEAALGSGFTYQGELSSDGDPVNDSCTFTFALYDAATAGNQLGSAQTENNVTVSDGRFTVQLNDEGQFGPNAFDGEARWLDISVQCSGDDGITALGRQPLTAAPQAQYALNAGSAAAAPWDGLTGVPADIADGDDDTTYSAGTGLTGGANQFSLSAPYRLPQSCSPGQIARWNDRNWICSNDQNTTYTAGDGLVLNGNQFSAQGTPYANVVVVAKSGGDFTHIQAALDSITDATSTNRYLLWVAPGLYQEQVTMKPYVDIHGASEDATEIRWSGGSQQPTMGPASATVIAANFSALRSLRVASVGTGSSYGVAVYAESLPAFEISHAQVVSLSAERNFGIVTAGGRPDINHVEIAVSGGSSFYNVGISNYSSQPTISHSAIRVSGANENRGVSSSGASPTLTDVTIDASGGNSAVGMTSANGFPAIYNSRISGDDVSVGQTATGHTNIASSELDGAASASNMTCVYSYDANLNELDNNCQPTP